AVEAQARVGEVADGANTVWTEMDAPGLARHRLARQEGAAREQREIASGRRPAVSRRLVAQHFDAGITGLIRQVLAASIIYRRDPRRAMPIERRPRQIQSGGRPEIDSEGGVLAGIQR